MSAVERSLAWEASLRQPKRDESPVGRRGSTSSPPMRYRSEHPPSALAQMRGADSPMRRLSKASSVVSNELSLKRPALSKQPRSVTPSSDGNTTPLSTVSSGRMQSLQQKVSDIVERASVRELLNDVHASLATSPFSQQQQQPQQQQQQQQQQWSRQQDTQGQAEPMEDSFSRRQKPEPFSPNLTLHSRENPPPPLTASQSPPRGARNSVSQSAPRNASPSGQHMHSMQELRDEIKRLSGDKQQLEQQLQQKSVEQEAMLQHVIEMQDQVKVLTQQQQQQQPQSTAGYVPEETHVSLQKKYVEVYGDMKRHMAETERLSAQVVGLDKQVEDALKAAEACKVERDQVQAEMQLLREQLSQLQRSSARDRDDTAQQLNQQIDALSHELKQAVSEKVDLHRRMQQLQQQLTETQSELYKLQQERQQERHAEITAAQQQLRDMHERLVENERQRETLQQQLRASLSVATHDTELDTALFGQRGPSHETTPSVNVPSLTPQRQQQQQQQQQQLPQSLSVSRISVSPSASQSDGNAQLLNELAATRISLQRATAERDNVLAELENHKRISQDLKALLVSNQTAVAQVRAELARSQGHQARSYEGDSKIQELERSCDVLQNERDRLSAEVKATQAQLGTTTRERDALKGELELLRPVIADLRKLLHSSQQTASRLEKDLTLSEEQRQHLQRALKEKDELLAQVQDVETRIVANHTDLLSENSALHQQIRNISNISAELETVLHLSPAGASRSSGYKLRTPPR